MEKQVDPIPDAMASRDCPVAPYPDEIKEDVSTRSGNPAEQYPPLRPDHS